MSDDKLATVEAQPLAQEGDTFLAFLERAARSKDFDVDKLERLLAMKEKQDAQERKRLFFEALARLQSKIGPIAKSGENPHTRSRYVLLDDLLVVIRPLLAEEGFALTFDSKPADPTHIEFTCDMVHSAGHSETRRLVLPIDGTGSQGGRSSMNDVQKVGSSTTYARRYLLDMHLNLARRDEDDDGNGGPKPVTQEQADLLKKALADKGGNVARFLEWVMCSTFEEIPAGRFDACMGGIRAMKARET